MMISADLGKSLEAYLQQLVDTGRYGSKSEVLREGVRLIQDRETRLASLDAALARGEADIVAGRIHDAEDVFQAVRERIQAIQAGHVK